MTSIDLGSTIGERNDTINHVLIEAQDVFMPDDVIDRLSGFAKRSIDLIAGTVLCLLVVPVILVLGVILAVQLRAWPLFVHERIGFGGLHFRMPKLRTLPLSTPTNADKTTIVLKPVSRLAARLRRSHLDELPQLFLVPLGRLSLVGPRPRMPIEVAETEQPLFDRRRVSVPQGCTGLWQVSPAQSMRVTDGPEYDLWYITNHTLRLDLWIHWRTLCQAFGGGPRDIHQVPTVVQRRENATAA